MAHPNLHDRRRAVLARMCADGRLNRAAMRELAAAFGCSPAAIRADMVWLTLPTGGASVFVSPGMRRRIFERDGRRCRYCGTDDPDASYIIEHVVPARLGGEARPHNLVVACDPCNAKKGWWQRPRR